MKGNIVSNSAYNLHVKMTQSARGALRNIDNTQVAVILKAYSELMSPPEDAKELTVATDVLSLMALLASKTLVQELMLRERGK